MARTFRFRCFMLSMCLTWLVSCASGQPAPSPTLQTETPTRAPETSAPTATPTPTLPPAGRVVRIKNVASNTYLYEADGQIKHGDVDSAAHWVIEAYQGSQRIQNQATGHYLSIEHLKPYVEALSIEPVWMSPRWTFDDDPSAGSTLIRNVWHNWEVLYVEAASDALRYGRSPADGALSQWILEPVDGSAFAAPTAAPVVAVPTAAQPIDQRGAATPWIEYEAEQAETNGTRLGPDRTFGTIAAEASGRVAVQLNALGEFVEFTSRETANSIVVRYVIPDAPQGGGITATLSLYVDGVLSQKLNLTSRYAWSYGGESYALNAPAPGAHHFFDEARALVAEIPVGAVVKLQKDADDAADYYVIDLVDLELVAPPKTMPAGFLSITTDCGAIAGDGQDDGPAIQTCIDRGRVEGKGVWIPAGIFESTSAPFEVTEVGLQGAGMWYSTVRGFYARFNCTGDRCRYADFAILGETLDRNDRSPENGFNGGAGSGSRLENIWVEHTKVGYWVGPGATDGLIILNSRFRNLFADGVNFAGGTRNSVVENSHFRNTGDDALASWSQPGSGVANTNNVFRFNTVQVPWRANCFALYGGQDNKIENNLCADVVTYPGILIAQSFNATPFAGLTTVQRNTLVRAGGFMYRTEHGALKIRAEQGTIGQVLIKDMLIDAPTFSGVELDGSYSIDAVRFENVEVHSAGTWGIVIRSNVSGKAAFKNVAVSNPAEAGLLNYAPGKFFTLENEGGNSGW